MLALIARSSPILAQDDCNHQKDFASGEKCFAAQFPCPYSYLGIDGTLDYAKALNICKADNSGAFVAVMYLNAEGTPRDLNKAEAALYVWNQKNPDQFSSSQAAALEKTINGCRRATTELVRDWTTARIWPRPRWTSKYAMRRHRFPPKPP